MLVCAQNIVSLKCLKLEYYVVLEFKKASI